MKQTVHFYTAGGLKLAGHLTLPAGEPPAPAVLMLPALLAGDSVMSALAERLAETGIASLQLDFRGCGQSEGEPGWLDPAMRVEDALNAFAWMSQDPRLDAGRLGVWGHRFGAPVAIGVGACEPRARAIVSSSGPGSGHAFMRALRSGEQWLTTLKQVRADRLQRAMTGKSTLVSLSEVVPMQAFVAKHQGSDPTPSFWLANIDAIMRFHTEDAAARLGTRPVLFVNGECDEVVAVEDVERVYRAVPGPKRLVVLPGLDHAGMEVGVGLEEQLRLATEWFSTYLKGNSQ